MINIKETLKARRKEKGWTQQFLADKVAVSQQYIGLIETGKISPSLKIVEKIADALDCELRLLLKQEF